MPPSRSAMVEGEAGTGPEREQQEAIEARLLAVVRVLADELAAGEARRIRVTLESHLDRDLGLDSLGRAELLQRLDRALNVELPDDLIAEAVTPGDLLRGVLAARPRGAPRVLVRAEGEEALPEAGEPSEARTLLEAFEAHVVAHGARRHLLIWSGEDEEFSLSYADLDETARRFAAGLLDRGIRAGDRVALMLPTGKDFFAAFLGTLMGGGIPVPVYPPYRRAQIEDHLRRQAGILRNARASLLVTDNEVRPLSGLLLGLCDSLRQVDTVDALSTGRGLSEPLPAAGSDTALIQYTSGSTGDPKGVVLTHANLLANIRAMGAAMQASSRDTFTSWLPLYHDMGLIGAWLGSLYFAAPVAVMPPLAFLASPARWLRSIHRHRATLSAAPNFAFELCLRHIRDEDIEGLDLSSLRMVVNGAEPVSPDTIARFTERFGAFGFRPEAMAPVYGLAECSVGLAFPPVGRAPIVDRVQREALSRNGEAVPAEAGDRNALTFVACGRPLPGHQVRVVDRSGHELPDRRQGRLEFKGPSTTSGYYDNPEKNRSLFNGEWLDSGDLAYIVAGDIYLTGRVKDIIIKGGRNIYPHELEEAVGNIGGVRKGCVVAFASRDEQTGTERLVVVAETRLTDAAELERLRDAINEASIALLEMPPDEIRMVPPHTVPKTSSGKIRRSAARSLYENNSLVPGGRALWLQLGRLWVSGATQRARRLIHHACEWTYAGYWWALLAALGIVVWPVVALLPGRARRHRVVRTAARLFLAATGLTPRVSGTRPEPGRGVILVSNHASYLDGLILSAVLPGEPTFIAKHEFRRQFVIGTFLRRLGTIFVHRVAAKEGVEDTSELVRAVERGEVLVAFPEGTFARMPGLLPFRLGAFLVAARTQTPVLPVAIQGTRMVFRDVQMFPRRGPIVVSFGDALRPMGQDFSHAVELRNRCRQSILEGVHEPSLQSQRMDLPPD